MRPDVRIFYSRLLPLPGWAMRGREGKGRRWGANREIARVSSISRSLTPRFRSATIILSKGGGGGKNERRVSTTPSRRQITLVSMTNRVNKSHGKRNAKQTRLCIRACMQDPFAKKNTFVLVLSFILENSRGKNKFLQGM